MKDAEQWGPWALHDGSGCPCVGHYVQAEMIAARGVFSNGKPVAIGEGIAGNKSGNWDWKNWGLENGRGKIHSKVIRYRIRKPRGLTILENLIAHIPQREDA